MKVASVRVQVFSANQKAGTSQRTGKPYSFWETTVQIDGTATEPAISGVISFREQLAPGFYDVAIESYVGQYNKIETRYGAATLIKAAK